MSKIKTILSIIFIFTIWGCVSSAYPIILWWSRECVLYLIIIIKPEVWIINHCLGLGHETMVCAVCLTMFLWNILGMIGLTPCTQGSFFYFLDPCLLAISPNTGRMDIHEILRILTQEAIGYTVSRLSRLFHALQTRRGGGLRSRNASCYVLCLQENLLSTKYQHEWAV